MTESNLPHFSSSSSPRLPEQGTKKTERGFLQEMVHFALIVFCIVLPIRIFIAQPFVVSGASMEPTFFNGEYLIVDEISYRFKEPARGDVIILKFEHPGKSQYLIKRIIGLPGETVSIKDGEVRIADEENPTGFILTEPYVENLTERPADTTVTLDATHYFVMGDNRPKSADSRIWGPLERENIVGRPFIRLLPLSKIETFPGRHTTGSN